ncbi:hypothetical protein BO70DRAFT_295164 [Aspergillus heteromorphus CBS 117.55]|uniref:Uncharacterized protein n=1 Tax=Aspergillus heteromorphus CBS 117.55 TaxID=1448321 RepID=A0A317VW53_9EURO|nr:uncharacterized protein BO70DRAFT_295164 [Aspergillus heteromorphus CBS 117.55]PWY77128.1 hypothetical protein BO70DRAFT_295164 [Aspergillus heteromorphus CBS 117.55]
MQSVQLSYPGSTTHSSGGAGMLPDRSSHGNFSGSITVDPPRASYRPSRVTNHRLDLEQRILGDRAERRESRLPGRSTSLHHSTRNATASHYAPRGPYFPIELQSAADGGSQEARPNATYNAHLPSDPESLRRGGRSCGSMLKETRARRRLITLVVSAAFLVLVVAIYLAFAASRTTLGRELKILLIFMILILGIVFCHSLTRFLMVILRRPDTDVSTNRIPSRAGPAGYAQPARPIHVILAGDEDVAESQSTVREKVTAPPPAYGLWRSSVRINPDLLYWQRVENNRQQPPKSIDRRMSNKARIPRPPSYTSDNGVDYVIEAQPRSLTQWHIPEEPER